MVVEGQQKKVKMEKFPSHFVVIYASSELKCSVNCDPWVRQQFLKNGKLSPLVSHSMIDRKTCHENVNECVRIKFYF